MNLRKSLSVLALCLLASSCGLLDLDHLGTGGISETKDMITEDSKFTSGKIDNFFESKKPTIAYKGNNEASILGAIKLKPYLLNTKTDLQYFLKVSVTGQKGTVTNELFFKCLGKEYFSHRLTKEDIEGINLRDHEIPTGQYSSFHYQEELIETKINKALFHYLVSCQSNLALRAKGNKSSMDSLLQFMDPLDQEFFLGLTSLKEKAEMLETAVTKK